MTDHRVGEDNVTGLRAMAEVATHNQITYQVKSARPTFVEIGYGFVEGIEFTATNDQGTRTRANWNIQAVGGVLSDIDLKLIKRTLNKASKDLFNPKTIRI